jgi:hypothetical protein
MLAQLPRMTIQTWCKGLCLAGVISLALGTTAYAAAPASQEYLPKVPKAAGGQGAHAGTAEAGTSGSAGAGESGNDKGSGKAAGNHQASAGSTDSGSSNDNTSGLSDTLFDPVVMLIVGGVIVIAIGMTLVRRRGQEEPGQHDSRPRGTAATAPQTPEGEIVSGGERPI